MFFKKKPIIKLFLLVSLFELMSAAEASDTVHAFYYDFRSQFVQRFDNSLQAYAKTRDIKVEKYDGKTKSDIQLSQVYSVVSSKDPLIINLIDPIKAEDVINHVKDYGNRVIFFNRPPEQQVLDSYPKAFYVGTNGDRSGLTQYEMISDYLSYDKNYDRNKNGFLDVIFLQGEMNSPDSDGRTNRILKLFSDNNIRFNLISKNYDNWLAKNAYEDLQSQIARVGVNNVDMIISNNDVMAIGAVKFLNTIGCNTGDLKSDRYIPVFGVDGMPEAIDLIRENKMTGTVFADFSALAKVVVELASERLTDESELTRKTWFKVQNKRVMIPFRKFANFKDYSQKTYPVGGYR